MRLSGTGSSGATVSTHTHKFFSSEVFSSNVILVIRLQVKISIIVFSLIQVRMYVDSYESDEANQLKKAEEMLAPCIDVALQISNLKKFTGRHKPTVIT